VLLLSRELLVNVVVPIRTSGALIVSLTPMPVKAEAIWMTPFVVSVSGLPPFAPALPRVKAPALVSKVMVLRLRPESIVMMFDPALKVATSLLEVEEVLPGAGLGLADQLAESLHSKGSVEELAVQVPLAAIKTEVSAGMLRDPASKAYSLRREMRGLGARAVMVFESKSGWGKIKEMGVDSMWHLTIDLGSWFDGCFYLVKQGFSPRSNV
jgi:hypothetical protein